MKCEYGAMTTLPTWSAVADPEKPIALPEQMPAPEEEPEPDSPDREDEPEPVAPGSV